MESALELEEQNSLKYSADPENRDIVNDLLDAYIKEFFSFAGTVHTDSARTKVTDDANQLKDYMSRALTIHRMSPLAVASILINSAIDGQQWSKEDKKALRRAQRFMLSVGIEFLPGFTADLVWLFTLSLINLGKRKIASGLSMECLMRNVLLHQ